MSNRIPYTEIIERVKNDLDYIAKEAYQKGYADHKKAKWAESGTLYHCDDCGMIQPVQWKYCPGCGAYMWE